jgi:acetyltransferase-like isoleucine patch superfamily enzyme
MNAERLIFKVPTGLISRVKIFFFRILGMHVGQKNRFERGRCRRLSQISIGNNNAFTAGYMLWPIDETYDGTRIKIGNKNYFNRNLMIDACGLIEIGDYNMFGPDVYITDSDHTFGPDTSPCEAPMKVGSVKIGNHCWIGAKAIILKNVSLGDKCVVAAGAVVTKSFPAGSVVGGIPAKLLKQF